MWHLHQMIQLQEIPQIPHPLKLYGNTLVVVTWEFINWINPLLKRRKQPKCQIPNTATKYHSK